jgi:hypothetical protein
MGRLPSRGCQTADPLPTNRLKPPWKKVTMRQFRWLALAFSLSCVGHGAAHAQQYPLLDKLAQRVVDKYQNSSCQQLAVERGQRPTGRKEATEQRVLEMLHSDANMRNEFINRVAAPIANKLFECGMIP